MALLEFSTTIGGNIGNNNFWKLLIRKINLMK